MYLEIPTDLASALALLCDLGDKYTGESLTDALQGLDPVFEQYRWSIDIVKDEEDKVHVYLLVNSKNEKEGIEWIRSYANKIDELLS